MVMQSPEKLNHQCNVLLLPGVSKQEVQNFVGEIYGEFYFPLVMILNDFMDSQSRERHKDIAARKRLNTIGESLETSYQGYNFCF